MSCGNIAFLKIEHLLFFLRTVIKNIDGLPSEIHFDAFVQCREGLAFKVIVFQQRDFPGSLVDFDDVDIRQVTIHHPSATNVNPQDGMEFRNKVSVDIEGLIILPSGYGGITELCNDVWVAYRKEQFLTGFDNPKLTRKMG